MKNYLSRKRVLLFTVPLLAFAAVMSAGCEHDTDPHAKIDAPGYYNGPMQKKSSGASLGGDSKEAGAAATK
jgi:hypothetical protein